MSEIYYIFREALENGNTKLAKETIRDHINNKSLISTWFVSPIHLAVHYKNISIVKFLIKNGVKLNCQTPFGDLPLHWAIQSLRMDIVRMLVYNGSPLNTQNSDCNTPLHIAVKTGFTGLVSILCEAGADPNIKNIDGHKPIDLTDNNEIRQMLDLKTKYNELEKKYNDLRAKIKALIPEN